MARTSSSLTGVPALIAIIVFSAFSAAVAFLRLSGPTTLALLPLPALLSYALAGIEATYQHYRNHTFAQPDELQVDALPEQHASI